jgi:hypothetical protein
MSDLTGDLTEIKAQALSAIAKAAAAGDASEITRLAKIIEALQADERGLTFIQQRISDYRDALLDGTKGVPPEPHRATTRPNLDRPVVGRKQRGEQTRKAFAATQGMQQVKGITYLSESRALIAVVTATEDPRGGRWWLGLPDRQFHVIVLICEGAHQRREFVIPMDELSEIWPELSRSEGNLKLNVRAEPGRYLLQVPGRAAFELTRFLGDYRPLH